MNFKITPAIIVLAAGLSLVACNKSTTDAQADAVRDTTAAAAGSIDANADAVENRGEAVGGVTENKAEATADAMRETADDMKDKAEVKADAIEDGTMGVTTATDKMVTTTPAKK